MAGNVLIKNANGKTVTLQNPDTNNIDITLDLSNIALDNEKVDIASFVGSNVSLSSSGYQKLPSGLIIQWGTKQINNTSINTLFTTAVTFPIAFPNAPVRVLSTPDNCPSAYLVVSSELATTTGFKIVSSTGQTGLVNVSYIAIGY